MVHETGIKDLRIINSLCWPLVVTVDGTVASKLRIILVDRYYNMEHAEKDFEQFIRDHTKEEDRIRLLVNFSSSIGDYMLPKFELATKPTLANKQMPRVRKPHKGPVPKSLF
jgi:hypothetical protein